MNQNTEIGVSLARPQEAPLLLMFKSQEREEVKEGNFFFSRNAYQWRGWKDELLGNSCIKKMDTVEATTCNESCAVESHEGKGRHAGSTFRPVSVEVEIKGETGDDATLQGRVRDWKDGVSGEDLMRRLANESTFSSTKMGV